MRVGLSNAPAPAPYPVNTIARNPRGDRLDHLFIVDVVEPGSRVLDLGCGRGTLLKMLVDKKQVRGTGVEISEERVYAAVEKGLSVYHGDIDEGLSDYPDGMFDYVILNQTLQQARETILLMHEALRVGRYIVVSFPNFAHWRARLQLLLRGSAPVTQALPYEWYDTPNIHSLAIRDFQLFVAVTGDDRGAVVLHRTHRPRAALAQPARRARRVRPRGRRWVQ